MNNSGINEKATVTEISRPGERVCRVGLFGGTFDPVHKGHIRIISDVKYAFCLEKVIVIPSAIPPHKTLKNVSDAKDRLAMTKMCFENRHGYKVSDVELNRSGPSYTIDTIAHFMALKQPYESLMLIMGSDAFFELHTWYSYRKIIASVPLIVMKRPGADKDLIKAAEDFLNAETDKGWQYDEKSESFVHRELKPVFLHEVSQMDDSSTEIRKRIKNNLDVSRFLLPEVEEYIRCKGLYK